MRIALALDFLHAITAAQFESLSDLIPSEFITTLRRRRMPMERLVWAIIGMAIFRNIPMAQLVNQLDILLPSDRPPSPVPRPLRLPASSPKTRVQEHQAAVSRNRSTMAPAGQSPRLGRAAAARRRWRDVAHA